MLLNLGNWGIVFTGTARLQLNRQQTSLSNHTISVLPGFLYKIPAILLAQGIKKTSQLIAIFSTRSEQVLVDNLTQWSFNLISHKFDQSQPSIVTFGENRPFAFLHNWTSTRELSYYSLNTVTEQPVTVKIHGRCCMKKSSFVRSSCIASNVWEHCVNDTNLQLIPKSDLRFKL